MQTIIVLKNEEGKSFLVAGSELVTADDTREKLIEKAIEEAYPMALVSNIDLVDVNAGIEIQTATMEKRETITKDLPAIMRRWDYTLIVNPFLGFVDDLNMVASVYQETNPVAKLLAGMESILALLD